MPSNSDLWQRVQAFAIDSAGTEFPFSARLARENGWSRNKAGAAIEEYKKFIYLICVESVAADPLGGGGPGLAPASCLHAVLLGGLLRRRPRSADPP